MPAVRTHWKSALVFATALAAAPAAASAQHVTLGATLTGGQEVPPRSTPATGFGTLMYHQGMGTIDISLQVDGLLEPTMGVGPGGAPAHVHFAPPDENGPIVIPLVGAPVGVQAFTYSNSFTFADLLAIGVPAVNVTQLQTTLNGLVGAPQGTVSNLYFNVHTMAFPGGEIRGNLAVVPEPSTYALLATGLGGLGLVARRRRRPIG